MPVRRASDVRIVPYRQPIARRSPYMGGASLLVLAVAGLAPASAQAAEECGAGPTVVCSPTGNPYGTGINYSTNSGLDLSFAPGVAVDASGADGIHVNNSEAGDVVVNTTNGSVRSADRIGIYVNNSAGGVTITTGDVTSDGSNAVYAHGNGPVAIDTTAGTVAGRGGIYAWSNTAAITITTADVRSTGGGAISASSYSAAATIDIDTTAGTISTEGDHSSGIAASSYVTDGPIRIVTGNVSTTGMYSNAVTGAQMSVGNSAPLVIDTTAGAISTQGDYSIGVGAYAASRAEVRTGPITTAGVESAGVYAHGAQAPVAVDTTAGTIQTRGASSAGILVSNAEGETTITAGQISTSGDAAIGIAFTSQNEGDAAAYRTDIVATGPITATGANAGGIVARDVGPGGPVNVTARANISAPGQNAVGIAAGSFGAPVTVTVDPGVTVMGGWSQNAGDLSTGASRSSTGVDEGVVSTYVGGGLPAAGIVLFSGATAGSPAARLINNGIIGAMNDRAVTMGFPCAGRSGLSGSLLLFNTTPTAPGGKSWLGTFASAIMNAIVPSARAAAPPASRGCDPGDPDWGVPP
ncbi:beta strand repeat-containing protein, partial [Phreatobacter sp. AB_2022a]|uniref:beta strand repeat-containing protein n=1 Tax=Phreatobacter sp. AB_2022a TaxID=3003134 RepID=UPI002287311A